MRLLRFLFCLFATSPSFAAHEPRFAAEMERSVLPRVIVTDEKRAPVSLARRMAELKVPALSIAVVRDERLVFAKAYGFADRDWKIPATTDTLFQAASISKPVTAFAALRLVAEGRLDLDRNVNDALISWQLPDNEFTAREKVTVRRILNHTAGLTVWGFPGYVRSEPRPSNVGVLTGEGSNTPPLQVFREPGKDWLYSGGGYTLLQLLLSDVRREPFPSLMRTLALEPLGMTHSTFEQPLPLALRHLAASGYDARGRKIDGDWHVYPEQAAAGLWTTPSDLARYLIAVQKMRAGKRPLLPAPLVRDMLTPGKHDHALGFTISKDRRQFDHGGSNEGFRAALVGFLDGRGGLVIMTNGDNGFALCAELIGTLGQLLDWPGLAPTERRVATVPDSALEAIAGTYRFVQPDGSSFDLDVARSTHSLAVTEKGALSGTLRPESAQRFFDAVSGRTIDFFVEPTGARMVYDDGMTGNRL